MEGQQESTFLDFDLYGDEEKPEGINFEEALDNAVEEVLKTSYDSGNINLETAVVEEEPQITVEQERAQRTKPPDTNIKAEVILIMTSLGSVRRTFFSSKRARHLLNCKDIVFYIIDVNQDVSEGASLCDQELYNEWKRQKILLTDPASTAADSVQIPQILVDGIPIGDEVMLQDMEEDGDLDWIFSRAACPACLHARQHTDIVCKYCGTKFCTLIPEEKVYDGLIQQMYRGDNYGAFSEQGTVFQHPKLPTGDAS